MTRPRFTKHWQTQRRRLREAILNGAPPDSTSTEVWLSAEEAFDSLAAQIKAAAHIDLESDEFERTIEGAARLEPLVRKRFPEFADFYGEHLVATLWPLLAERAGVPIHLQNWPWRAARPAVGSPLSFDETGGVIGWENANMRHLQQLRDYGRSLQAEKPRGRPPGTGGERRTEGRSLDVNKAILAFKMKRDGADWREIADAVDINFAPYDTKSVEAARAKVKRLVERGGIELRKKSDANK
jgi:hypothetical protein